MKKIKTLLLGILMTFAVCAPVASTPASTTTVDAATLLLGSYTGYDSADDVSYEKTGSYTQYSANWGARGETCTFLTSRASEFYGTTYSFDQLSQKSGGSSSTAPQSALYKALQSLMLSRHTTQTNYNETKGMYRYTDCVNGNPAYISSFYSATQLNGSWGSGWNREHTWPNSKDLDNNTNTDGPDSTDIMMLRPTAESENSSRGNDAYGESSGYYNPNSEGNGKVDLRGDCARIVLYVYTRWGDTGIWGTSGVMQSMDVLLKWMAEDPVDTWEMGRNDVVQEITKTRNVFVDFPEYAWLLFSQDVPKVATPSGIANGGKVPTPTPDPTPDPDPTPSMPTANSKLTIAQVLALDYSEDTTAKYYITGTVDEIDNPTWGNLYIKDSSGNRLYVYGTYNNNGSKRFDVMDNPPKVGDVVVYYSILGIHNGTKELKDAWVMEINPEPDPEPTPTPTPTPNPGTTPDDSGCEHSYGKWFIEKNATESEEGSQTRFCEKCGHQDVQVIPMLPAQATGFFASIWAAIINFFRSLFGLA